jgi:hypothetical protein
LFATKLALRQHRQQQMLSFATATFGCVLTEGRRRQQYWLAEQQRGLTYLIKRLTSFQDKGECAGGTSSPGTIASDDSKRYSANDFSIHVVLIASAATPARHQVIGLELLLYSKALTSPSCCMGVVSCQVPDNRLSNVDMCYCWVQARCAVDSAQQPAIQNSDQTHGHMDCGPTVPPSSTPSIFFGLPCQVHRSRAGLALHCKRVV